MRISNSAIFTTPFVSGSMSGNAEIMERPFACVAVAIFRICYFHVF